MKESVCDHAKCYVPILSSNQKCLFFIGLILSQKIGDRAHSTVIYTNNKILNTMDSDLNFKKMVQDIGDSVINKPLLGSKFIPQVY